MITTVRTATKRIQVSPNPTGYVDLSIYSREGQYLSGLTLSPDEVGALLFGIEQAADAAGIAKERVGL